MAPPGGEEGDGDFRSSCYRKKGGCYRKWGRPCWIRNRKWGDRKEGRDRK